MRETFPYWNARSNIIQMAFLVLADLASVILVSRANPASRAARQAYFEGNARPRDFYLRPSVIKLKGSKVASRAARAILWAWEFNTTWATGEVTFLGMGTRESTVERQPPIRRQLSCDHLIRLCVVGCAGNVRTDSLIDEFLGYGYRGERTSCIPWDFKIHRVIVDEERIELHVWNVYGVTQILWTIPSSLSMSSCWAYVGVWCGGGGVIWAS